jgi:hypothetical protein
MTGRMVAAGVLAFGAGWFCGVANHVRRCWPTILGLTRRLAEADTCHDCATAVGRLSAELADEARKTEVFANYIAWQEQRIDQLEHEQVRDRFDPVAEAEQILDLEAGS